MEILQIKTKYNFSKNFNTLLKLLQIYHIYYTLIKTANNKKCDKVHRTARYT